MEKANLEEVIATVQRTADGAYRAVVQDPPLVVTADTLDDLPRAIQHALSTSHPGTAHRAVELRLRLDGLGEPPTCDAIVAELRQHQADLAEHGVARLAVFGSVARGEATPESDVDLLVAFGRPVGLFGLVGLKEYLQGLLGRPVDLTTENGLRPAMRERVLREAVVAIG